MRGHEANIMSERRDLAPPVVCGTACFDSDEAWRGFPEKMYELRSRIAPTDYYRAICINCMHLKHVLCDIQTDRCDLHLRSPNAANQHVIVSTPIPQPSHFIREGPMRRLRDPDTELKALDDKAGLIELTIAP
jgi:hypothetical protein